MYVCKNCESKEVDFRTWLPANRIALNPFSMESKANFLGNLEAIDTYCPSCDCHAGIKWIEEDTK